MYATKGALSTFDPIRRCVRIQPQLVYVNWPVLSTATVCDMQNNANKRKHTHIHI